MQTDGTYGGADDRSGSSGGYGNLGDTSMQSTDGLNSGAADAQQGSFAPGGTSGSQGSQSSQQNAGQGGSLRDQVGDKVSETASQAKEKASQLKSTLADKLEAGAGALRNRVGQQNTSTDGIVTTGDGAQDTQSTINRAGTSLADGMEKTADWLRDADFNDMRASVERQVRENPGRALLIAVGVGYLLGKAFRGGSKD
jgi:ElaB/YqjD/DUF883 family membrane-anchored ribosome-binding protein